MLDASLEEALARYADRLQDRYYTLRDGRTLCPKPDARCLNDRYGDVRCSAPGGGIEFDRYGEPVCGPGYCTRDLRGAHVEFFRGVKNPIGVKLGPKADPDELLELLRVLNPNDEAGKLVLIARMGEGRVAAALPPLVEAVRRAGRRVLWVCDPMHGNTHTTASGLKTRSFDRILRELEQSLDVHQALGSTLGGVHFELTGEDVTECLGAGTTEDDLDKNYASLCDPRLNYRQAMEVALRLARRLSVT